MLPVFLGTVNFKMLARDNRQPRRLKADRQSALRLRSDRRSIISYLVTLGISSVNYNLHTGESGRSPDMKSEILPFINGAERSSYRFEHVLLGRKNARTPIRDYQRRSRARARR